MSGMSGLRFLFGTGNLQFFKLLKPIGQGYFSTAFNNALTIGGVGNAALTAVNAEENWRKGNASAPEALGATGAAFFGCIGGGAGPILSITYSIMSSYLTMFSMVKRVEHYREQNPGTEFVPDTLIKGSDHVDLIAAPTVALTQQISKLTGGNAGRYFNALNIARSVIGADKSQVLAFCKSPDVDLALCQQISPPENLNLQMAALGDKLENAPITAVIEFGNIN
jgi:hypothetical protein